MPVRDFDFWPACEAGAGLLDADFCGVCGPPFESSKGKGTSEAMSFSEA